MDKRDRLKSKHTQQSNDGGIAKVFDFHLGKDRVKFYLDELQKMIDYSKQKGYSKISLF